MAKGRSGGGAGGGAAARSVVGGVYSASNRISTEDVPYTGTSALISRVHDISIAADRGNTAAASERQQLLSALHFRWRNERDEVAGRVFSYSRSGLVNRATAELQRQSQRQIDAEVARVLPSRAVGPLGGRHPDRLAVERVVAQQQGVSVFRVRRVMDRVGNSTEITVPQFYQLVRGERVTFGTRSRIVGRGVTGAAKAELARIRQ